jgi:NADH-quinone oxidoreductase subunit J
MELFLFCFFSLATLLCCFFVAFLSTPINSVFYLVLAFCNAAGLLILVESEFLALLFLIVYVGAIAVLFLFVIMMLNLKESSVDSSTPFVTRSAVKQNQIISCFIFFILFFQTLSLFSFDFVSLKKNVFFFPVNYVEWVFYLDFSPNIDLFGQLVYSYFFFYFLVAGFILLVAMVSAVVLTAQKKNNSSKRQLTFIQLSRTTRFSVFLINPFNANKPV